MNPRIDEAPLLPKVFFVVTTYTNASEFTCLSLRALRQHLLSRRREEETRLNEESDKMLEELRESTKREREQQQHKLRSTLKTHQHSRP